MAFSTSTIAASLLLLYLSLKLISFIRFYVHGRRSGYPVCISPIPSKSVPWMVLGPVLVPHLKKFLPDRVFERLDLVTNGWEFRRKAQLYQRLGKAFVLVTPDECSLWIEDPALGNVILQRRKEFIQAPIVAKLLGLFGPNIIMANGDDWQRQRRLVAPNLNERVSETVWNESCQQACVMLTHLLKHPGNQTLGGLRCLAINVMGAAAYGQRQSWAPGLQDLAHGWEDEGRGAYFKTIAMVADSLITAALLPSAFLKMPFMPRHLQLLGYHKERMPIYTKRVLDEERNFAKEGAAPRSNILSMLVRLSDEGARGKGNVRDSSLSLTDDEISGNLFVFSTAGFETTAHTMGYAVMLLATYPEWQDWIYEELQGLDPDVTRWRYEEIYSRCTRIQAVMLETLRLYSPVGHPTRHIDSPQQIADDKGTHFLAPPMDVYVSAQCLHTEPEIWGPDVLEFRPSRWINEHGEIITPEKGTYLPWSGGPRICPGMKMSQVEFVATIATLFRSARCEPLVAGGQSMEDARRRLQDLMDDSSPKLSLQVKDAAQVKLRWVTLGS